MKDGRRRFRPLRVEAPLRADLAGGTLDIWPLGLLHPGAVTVAVALSLRARAELSPSPDPSRHRIRSADLGLAAERPVGVRGRASRGRLALYTRLVALLDPGRGTEIVMRSPVRAGSGLGTSSALGIALAAGLSALSGRRRPPGRLVGLVRDVEAEILGIPTGTQDHWAACRGGIVLLEHGPDGPRVSRTSGAQLAALSDRLLLIDTGRGRSSGPSNWDMFRRRLDGHPAAVRALAAVTRAARRAAEALAAGDWRALGRAMSADLFARAEWSPLVLPRRAEAILTAARRAGAWGARMCGAGGGGFGVALAPPERRRRVADAVAAAGGAVVPARGSARGLRIEAV